MSVSSEKYGKCEVNVETVSHALGYAPDKNAVFPTFEPKSGRYFIAFKTYSDFPHSCYGRSCLIVFDNYGEVYKAAGRIIFDSSSLYVRWNELVHCSTIPRIYPLSKPQIDSVKRLFKTIVDDYESDISKIITPDNTNEKILADLNEIKMNLAKLMAAYNVR